MRSSSSHIFPWYKKMVFDVHRFPFHAAPHIQVPCPIPVYAFFWSAVNADTHLFRVRRAALPSDDGQRVGTCSITR